MRVALLLEGDEAFRQRWQRRFDYVLIDEYQDTNHAQYLIARDLAAEHRNICATGDPDQSIYGWRGADIRNILDFTKDYRDGVVVKLERNYRSTKTILRAADTLITRNAQRHERSLWTENDEGVAVGLRVGEDAEGEARAALAAIHDRRGEGRRWGDFAVFYRTNAQSRSFEEACVRGSVPYRIVGAVEFYGRQEVKDLLAYLRVCVNERDDLSLLRIINTPSRGIGKRTVDALKRWAAAQGMSLWAAATAVEQVEGVGATGRRAVTRFAELIRELREADKRPVAAFCARVLADSGYEQWLKGPDNEERRENVEELLGKCTAYDALHPDSDLGDFLQEVALVSEVDNLDGAADAVTLMTLHAAKGLEFPVVLLSGMEEGLLPHANSMATEEEVEEERRLCYVGITRAQDELVFTAARQRAQRGAQWGREPSRFLHEIDRAVLDDQSRRALAEFQATSAQQQEAPEWAPRPRRSSLGRRREPASRAPAVEPTPVVDAHGLSVGDWVEHPMYGRGRVVALQESERMALATVAMSDGVKRLFSLEHVALKRL